MGGAAGQRWFATRWTEIAAVVLVVLISLKATYGLLGTFDLYLDDESMYLEGARVLGNKWLPLATSSPLYPMWYRVVALFEPDRLNLYFANWFVLTGSLPIALYALARRSGAPLASAAAIAVGCSVSFAAITWPFVTKFVVLLLTLGALASTFVEDPVIALAIGAVALSLASYARAELTMFAYAAVAIVAGSTLRGFMRKPIERVHRTRAVPSAIAIAVVSFLRLRFGDTGANNRAYVAFSQHYALNVVEDKRIEIDPWANTPTLVAKDFPTATTIVGAMRENRAAFAWHVMRNLTMLPKAINQLVRPMMYVPVPLRNLVSVAFLAAIGAGIVGFIVLGFERLRPRSIGRLGRWLPLLGFLVLATSGSALIIHPREHYVLPVTFITAVALASGGVHLVRRLRAFAGVERARPLLRVVTIALLAVFLVVVPTLHPGAAPALAHARTPAPSAWPRDNVRTIELLRQLKLQGRPYILEPSYSHGIYTPYEDFMWVPPWLKEGKPFWDFMHERQVNVVVVNDVLRTDTRFVDDPDFERFVDAPDDAPDVREDFVRYPVEGTDRVLLVRRSLLPRRDARPAL
jgi:hypothetical protein